MAPKTKEVEVKEELVVTTPENIKADTVFNAFLDHQRKAIAEAAKALQGLIPEDAREHSQAAFNEMIEGYRALFNATLDSIKATMEKPVELKNKLFSKTAEVQPEEQKN